MRVFRGLRLALTLLLSLGCIGALPATAHADEFVGVWEGQITFLTIPGQFAPNKGPQWTRLVIGEDAVKVYCCADKREIKPGEFTIDSHGSNAVVYAIESDEGRWTETWNFTLMLRGDDTMQVVFSRAVNNHKSPLSDPVSKFNTTGYGRFTRVN